MAFPVLLMALILQTAIIGRINLLYGSADLILVVLAAWALQKRVTTSWQWALVAGVLVAFVSALPWFVSLAGYLLIVGMARLLQRRIWQAPLLAMFAVSFIGTLILHILSVFSLRLFGDNLPVEESFTLITLPSILLNLLLAIPVYAGMRDLAGWLYPAVAEE